jgi:hypothetical protein
MDLDELRDALDEAGSRSEVDVVNARREVGARARRHRRRQRGLASLVALMGAIALTVAALAIVASRHTHEPVTVTVTPSTKSSAPTSSTEVSATTSPKVTDTTTVATTTPITPQFSYLYVYPFPSLAEAQAWQRAYRSGGHQPWHLDPGMTATSFADFLGYAMADQVISVHTDASGAHVALGYHNPNGVPVTSSVVHLVRVSNGNDAPWEVVGNDQSSDFTLTSPKYAAAAVSPMRVAGTITGVDDNIRVSVRQPSSNLPLGGFCCLPAGGVNSPWSTTASFTNATDPILVISASTGGHLQTIERFVFTATRRAG